MTHEQKQKIILIGQNGTVEVDPDKPTANAHDLVSVPLGRGERRVLLPAATSLDINGQPMDYRREGVTQRLDGATVAILGGTVIEIPAEQQK